MSVDARPQNRASIVYPETDRQPLADTTKQFRWIVFIVLGLRALFRNNPLVFVAGDLFWYPVEGEPEIRRAPDAMVVFGRPKGDRSAYLQWREDNLAPQVVFEVLSPGNTLAEMAQKFEFYDIYGVEEYYLYDPERGDLSGWVRRDGRLRVIELIQHWQSPRMGVQFDLSGGELRIIRPGGAHVLEYDELEARFEQAQQQAEQAQQQAEQAQQQAEQAQQQAERLAARLRALGVDPEKV